MVTVTVAPVPLIAVVLARTFPQFPEVTKLSDTSVVPLRVTVAPSTHEAAFATVLVTSIRTVAVIAPVPVSLTRNLMGQP